MIFTSDLYVLFLIAAFALHWLLPERARKPFLIAASYVFYASWSWRYLFLLLGVSLFNWAYARWAVARVQKSGVLLLGIAVNVGVLAYFKYAGFFLDNVRIVAGALGVPWALPVLHVTLPLGISFFTFQGVAYLVDVASGDPPLPRLMDFLLFKGFWPQLIAGPIVRISEIRDQIETRRRVTSADLAAGARRILIGFNKKLVLADSLSGAVESVFAAGAAPTGLDSLLATVAFGFQIYFDFSAYSDIAIGSARLFGFTLPENFNWPYVAASPQEFWNRWHMTLSRWIRDYVFTPMSFALRRRPRLEDLALLGAMTICGLWHGANWTFVLWGVWHGVLLVANRTFMKRWWTPGADAGPARRAAQVGSTFVLVSVGWVLFRARSVRQAAAMLGSIATLRGGFHLAALAPTSALLIVAVVAGFALAAALRGRIAAAAARLARAPAWLPMRPLADVMLIHLAIVFGGSIKPFVYFQF